MNNLQMSTSQHMRQVTDGKSADRLSDDGKLTVRLGIAFDREIFLSLILASLSLLFKSAY